jgi:hypothetical protein
MLHFVADGKNEIKLGCWTRSRDPVQKNPVTFWFNHDGVERRRTCHIDCAALYEPLKDQRRILVP